MSHFDIGKFLDLHDSSVSVCLREECEFSPLQALFNPCILTCNCNGCCSRVVQILDGGISVTILDFVPSYSYFLGLFLW